MLEGPKGKVEIGQGVIVAQRHIHMRPADAARMGVRDGESVRLRTYTQRPVVLEAVTVRVSPDFATYAHLDYDEANACGFREGDLGRIVP
jgi:propanediol utilization protein